MKSKAGGFVRALCLHALLLLAPALASAGTVNELVTGPHGMYRVYLYNETSQSPIAVRDGAMQYGGFVNFAFTGCQSGHAYWAKAVRLADGMTRVGGGSVYLWWYQFSIRLPDINFPYSSSAGMALPVSSSLADSTQVLDMGSIPVRKTSWGALKAKYR